MRFLIASVALTQLAAVLAAVTPGTFPCPAVYGTCNTCTIGKDGQVAALTREPCGNFTTDECVALVGATFVCNDGCNTCSCGENRLLRTRIGCPEYDYQTCVESVGGDGYYIDGGLRYECTKYGLASQHGPREIVFSK